MNAPLHWVRRIAPEIAELNQIPLFGKTPPFDWEHFSSLLSSRLGVQQLLIRPKAQGFKKSKHLAEGLGEDLISIGVEITPIGDILWIMSETDMGKLANGMVNSSSKAGPLPSELLQEGFYRYILLEALATLGTLPPFTGLTLCTLEEPKEIEEGFYVDIEISIDQKKCWGRLLLPMDFRSLWIRHFADSSIEYVSKEVAKSTFLSLGIKTGSLSVKKSEWEPLHLGDFVPLDKNSYDAHKGTGICMLMLRDIPLFHAKIKNNRVELIDYAFYYEDTMEETRPKKSAETPKPLQDEPRKFPSQEMEPVSIKELPLDITVEIGRIRITLDQLMQLTPGNQLELPIHPDQGVNLTVGGNKIGRAELVYLGEQLGIRILEI